MAIWIIWKAKEAGNMAKNKKRSEGHEIFWQLGLMLLIWEAVLLLGVLIYYGPNQ